VVQAMVKIIETRNTNAREKAVLAAGLFDVVSQNNDIILPAHWKRVIRPGSTVKIVLRTEKVQELGIDKKPITLQDPVGRKFIFPFEMCKTWQVCSVRLLAINHQPVASICSH
jgi:hypothetical protein